MIILCLKVFFARILDVTLGTIRTIYTVKGKRMVSSVIGFFEVLIWFLVVREALNTDESSIYVAISYGLGFATGTYLGGFASSLLIKCKIVLSVITSNLDLADILRDNGYGVTCIDCTGYNKTKKNMLYISVDSKKEKELRKLIEEKDKEAFILESETSYVANGYYK